MLPGTDGLGAWEWTREGKEGTQTRPTGMDWSHSPGVFEGIVDHTSELSPSVVSRL